MPNRNETVEDIDENGSYYIVVDLGKIAQRSGEGSVGGASKLEVDFGGWVIAHAFRLSVS